MYKKLLQVDCYKEVFTKTKNKKNPNKQEMNK